MARANGGEPVPWPTYRILGVAARLDELRINRRLAHLGLTKGALDALESVADLEPANVSDLAALMSVSKQSLGKVLRRLESLGLVSKERGSDGVVSNSTSTNSGRTRLLVQEYPRGYKLQESLVPSCSPYWTVIRRRQRFSELSS